MVKNIWMAGGDAEVRHGWCRRVRLAEVPISERALSKSPERAAKEYFGLQPYPTVERLEPLASRCPGFRIEESGEL